MKGISPVIATVLLLLMVIGAISGAWVWYQRMQAQAQLGGEAGVQSVKRGAYASMVYIDMAYLSGGSLKLDIGNQADSDVSVEKIEYRTSQTSQTFYTCSGAQTLKANDITSITCSETASGLGSGDMIYVRLYFPGAVTREIGVMIE